MKIGVPGSGDVGKALARGYSIDSIDPQTPIMSFLGKDRAVSDTLLGSTFPRSDLYSRIPHLKWQGGYQTECKALPYFYAIDGRDHDA